MQTSQCPRCGGQLAAWDSEDASCLQCGHIVYKPDERFSGGLLEVDLRSEKADRPDTSGPREERKP